MQLCFLLMMSAWSGGVDGHGPVPPANDGDAMAPLRLQDASAQEASAAAVVLEFVDEPVNLYTGDANDPQVAPQLDDLLLANLQLAVAKDRFAATLVVPLVGFAAGEDAAGGPSLADPELRLPTTLLDGGFSVTVAPILRIPLGDSLRFLGDGGVGGGGLLSLGLLTGPLVWTGNIGLIGRPINPESHDDPFSTLQVGGATVNGGLGVGIPLASSWALHLETVGSYGLFSDPYAGNAFPIESSAAVRAVTGDLWWVGGVGTGLNAELGSPRLRVFLGGGVRWGMASEPVVDAVVEVTEAEPLPEEQVASAVPVQLQVRDLLGTAVDGVFRWSGEDDQGEGVLVDGKGEVSLLPGTYSFSVEVPGLGAQTRELWVEGPQSVDVVLLESKGPKQLALKLSDPSGAPLSDARVLVDGLPVGEAGSGGELAIGGLSDGPHQVVVQAHGYRSWIHDIPPEMGLMGVQLFPVEGSLRVLVVDADGSPISDAFVSFHGERNQPAVPLGASGDRLFVLSPGTWTALVSSERYGLQSRDVVLESDAWTTAEARFVLRDGENGDVDLRVMVRDVDGMPVDGAEIRLGDQLLGETSTGGDLSTRGLLPGTRNLAVHVNGAAPIAQRELFLQPGRFDVSTTVHWLPGTVSIRVRSPEGPVADAVIVASGPAMLSPMPLGPQGTLVRQFALGDWEFLITSEQYGTASRRIHVEDGRGGLQRVEVVLRPVDDAALAELQVDVVDPDGAYLAGAQLSLDQSFLGTSAATTTVFPGLLPGSRTLSVRSGGWRPWDKALSLHAGLQVQQVALDWMHAVHVRAIDAQGDPVPDAMVRLVGANGATPPMLVDTLGERTVPVEVGEWQLIASSELQGLSSVPVSVTEEMGRIEAVVRFPASAGPQLLVTVRDSLDRPVPNASVSCQGCSGAETTVGGVLLLQEVPAGDVAMQISAPHHRTRTVQWRVDGGAQERVAVLEPLLVQTRVRVVDEQGRPVDAQVRLDGPQRVPPVWTGDDGEESVPVVPGRWRVTAVADGFGAQHRDVTIEPGSRGVVVDFVLGAGRVQVVAGTLVISEQVHFALGSAALEPGSTAILQEVADTLLAHPEIALLEIQGHSDATGDLALNQQLSEERAAAVLRALVDRGVSGSRLRSRGYGPTRPVADNRTDEGRTANRRVQFDIVERASLQ